MISALQGQGEPAAAQPGGQGRASTQEFDVPRRGEYERRDRVSIMRVDSEADEHHVRSELLDDRLDDPVVGREVRGVPAPRRERDVDGESAALSRPDVLDGTRAWENPVLVGRHVQDGCEPGKDVARPVPGAARSTSGKRTAASRCETNDRSRSGRPTWKGEAT